MCTLCHLPGCGLHSSSPNKSLCPGLVLPLWALLLIRGGLLAVLGRGLDWARVMWRVPLPVVSMEGEAGFLGMDSMSPLSLLSILPLLGPWM